MNRLIARYTNGSACIAAFSFGGFFVVGAFFKVFGEAFFFA